MLTEWLWSRRQVFALLLATGVTTAVLLWVNDGAESLWDLPGKSVDRLTAHPWRLPEDPAQFIERDRWLILSLLVTVTVGSLVGARWTGGRSRIVRVVAPVVMALGYVHADLNENSALLSLVTRHPDGDFRTDGIVAEIDSADILSMARWHNAKWLLLVSALLLMVSLWNRRLPRRPGNDKDRATGAPRDWFGPDNPAVSVGNGRTSRPWAADRRRLGISVSGGGVRSASFAFGVMEVLRERRLLQHARYVTSVSGGSYATRALEQANRSETRPDEARGLMRRRVNYLVPGLGEAAAAVSRLLLGLAVNLVLIYLVIFAIVRPVGWLIGTPAIDGGLRISQPFVNEILHDDDDPDHEGPQEWAVKCPGGPSPDTPLTIQPDRTVVGDGDQLTFTLGVPDQCVRLRTPEGTEDFVAVGVYTSLRGVVSFDDGTAEIVRQPVLRTLRADDRLGDEQDGVDLSEALDVTVPDIELSGRADSGVTESLSTRSLFEDPGELVVAATSITDRREGTDLDDLDWRIPLVGLVVALALWAIGGNPWLKRRLDEDRWGRRLVRWAPRIVVGFTFLTFLVFVGLPWLVEVLPSAFDAAGPSAEAAAEAGIGWLPVGTPALLAYPVLAIASVLKLVRGSPKAGAEVKVAKRNSAAFFAKIRRVLGNLIVIPLLFALAVVTATTIMTTAALNGPFGDHVWISEEVFGFELDFPLDYQLWAIVVLALLLLARFFPAGSWSLGPFYRSRLHWAFNRGDPDPGSFNGRDPGADPVLNGASPGNAPGDDQRRAATRAERAGFVDGKVGDGTELVVCCAANITGPDRAPTGRHAVSYSASRSWIGGPELGWVDTTSYLDVMGKSRGNEVSITSMTALSGAAVSPAMGKGSRGPVGSLLAVLNVRLGGWLPHPGAVRARLDDPQALPDRWRHTPGWPYFLREVLRRHDHEAHYVYVTDGGHWENLGLVEALRRGCNTIIAISAAGDGALSHATFAQAVEIARSDLGVEIEMDDIWRMRPTVADEPDAVLASKRQFLRQAGDAPETGTVAPFGFAYGTFERTRLATFHPARRGEILLIEATMVDDLPVDVHAYAEGHPEFPDISTGDQFFDNADFDAYRMLGRVLTVKALEHEGPPERPGAPGPKIGEDFVARVKQCDRRT